MQKWLRKLGLNITIAIGISHCNMMFFECNTHFKWNAVEDNSETHLENHIANKFSKWEWIENHMSTLISPNSYKWFDMLHMFGIDYLIECSHLGEKSVPKNQC